MGDYTLCNLHFTLKEETPEEVLDFVSRKLTHKPGLPSDPTFLDNFYPCSSAYHHIESFVEQKDMCSEFYGDYEGTKFNTIFQAKYGRGISEFEAYIGPWVIVNEWNRGCIGWILSEYCNVPTYLFVKSQEEDPKDKYIHELESKCQELVEKLKIK